MRAAHSMPAARGHKTDAPARGKRSSPNSRFLRLRFRLVVADARCKVDARGASAAIQDFRMPRIIRPDRRQIIPQPELALRSAAGRSLVFTRGYKALPGDARCALQT